MSDSTKRDHDPPTGLTPGKKPPKRRSASGRFTKTTLFKPDIQSEDFGNVCTTLQYIDFHSKNPPMK
jgi:hypothetical protein